MLFVCGAFGVNVLFVCWLFVFCLLSADRCLPFVCLFERVWFVVACCLFAVRVSVCLVVLCWLLLVCLVFAVCLFVVCLCLMCLLFAVGDLFWLEGCFGVSGVLFAVYCLVCCLLVATCCLLFVVWCLTSGV